MTMNSYAIVKDGVVVNVVAWDGVSEWTPPEGTQAIESPEAGIGWLHDGTAFHRPQEEPAQQN